MAQATRAETERNKEIVRRFVQEVVNEGNYNVADELFADKYVRHDPTIPEEKRGPDGFKETVEMWRTGFPDVEMTLDEMIADGDLVAFRATEVGTHEGEFMRIAPTGERYEVTGNVMYRLEDGKLIETWACFDMLGLFSQLGVVETPR
jgi:predicted ester cyclase